jgi:hypothetical protein
LSTSETTYWRSIAGPPFSLIVVKMRMMQPTTLMDVVAADS